MAEETKMNNLMDRNHLRDYLQIVQKHKYTVVATFVTIVTTVIIGTFAADPVYTASTTIQIEKEPPKVLKFEDVLPIDGSGIDYYQTQQELIRSRAIAKRVIEKLSLWNHPQFKVEEKSIVPEAEAAVVAVKTENLERLINSFLKLLDVNMTKNSRLASISYSSHYPELSANIANEVANSYIDFNLEYKFRATEKARDWLTEQLGVFQAKVEKSEEALNSFARRHGIFSLEKDENLVMMRLEKLNESLSDASADRIAKQSFYKEVNENPLQTILSIERDDLHLVNALKIKLSDLDAEYSNLSKLYKPDYPRMVRLKAKMDVLEKKIEKEAENFVNKAEMNYMISLERERLLLEALEKQKEHALKIKEKSIPYNIIKREVDTNNELYDGLLQRVKETGVSAGLESSNIQVIDRAEPPLNPSKPNKKLNIILSIIVGLSLGVGLACFFDYYDNSIKDPDEIMRLFNLPTLGIIPSFQSLSTMRGQDKNNKQQVTKEDLYLVSKNYPRSTISEACYTFKTSLLFSTPGHPPKTILITSNNPQEGKTFLSCNLGIVLAQGGAKTLIIDADLRRPFVHKAFSIPNDLGLTSYLTGYAKLEEIIRPADIEGLFILPAGPISPNPSGLLDSSQFKEAVEKLKGEFDFVLYDSAPVMHFADSLNLASKVDGAIIVINGGKTTRDDLKHSVGLLKRVNASILGVVVNNADISRNGYYYYNYNYYYGEGGEDSEVGTGPALS